MSIVFNSSFYLQSKFNQLQAEGLLEAYGLTDLASLTAYFEENSIDAQQHYLNYGMAEGVNPSPEFDTTAYLHDKLAQLQSEQYAGRYAEWRVADLAEHFKSLGLTALDHYHQSGINEGIEPQAPLEATQGEAVALSTGTDDLAGTELNDTFNAVASVLASERTLNPDDSIDGGEGNDTLNVSLNSGFTGFSEAGSVRNIETIALSNSGSIARTFSATGVEGVETYQLTGAVNLEDVAAANALVSVAERTANLNITFTDEAVEGTDNTLSLAVANTGSFAENGSVDTAMGVTANGMENVTIAATGENALNLSGTNASTITFTGSGSIALTDVANSGLTSVDASALEGSADLNLASLTGATVNRVLTGAGDDVIRLQAGNDISTNATIHGSEGNDRVLLSSATATTQYLMSGIETLALANSGNLIFSARTTTGLETIEATAEFENNATFAYQGGTDLIVALVGNNANSGNITTDHSGVATVNVTSDEDGDSHNANLTFTNANALLLNVAEDSIYNGSIEANQAQSIEAGINGQLTGANLAATTATSAVFNTGEEATTLAQLNAAKLVDLNVTAAGSFTVNGGNLSGLEALTLATEGAFDSHSINMAAIAQLALSGSGSVHLGNLGDTRDTYGITLNAEGLNDGLEVGTITTGGTNININAADVLGDVELGKIDAGTGNVTVDVSGLGGDLTFDSVTGQNLTLDASGALGNAVGGVTIFATTPVGLDFGELYAGNRLNLTGAELTQNTAIAIATGDTFTANVVGGLQQDNYTLYLSANTTTLNLSGDLASQASGESDQLTIELMDITGDAVTATYNVQNAEELTFNFDDANDVVTLTAASALAGVETLTIDEGTLDITAASGFAGEKLVVGSGVRMTAAQFASLTDIDAQADADISITINSVEDAQRVAKAVEALTISNTTPSFRLLVAETVSANSEVVDAIATLAKSPNVDAVFQEVVAADGTTTPKGISETVNLETARTETLAAEQYEIKDTLVEILKENENGSSILANANTITAEDINNGNGLEIIFTEVADNGAGERIRFGNDSLTLTQAQLLTMVGTDSASEQYRLKLTDNQAITVNTVTVANGDFAEKLAIVELNGNDTITFSGNEATLEAKNFTTVFTTLNVNASGIDTITIDSLKAQGVVNPTLDASEANDIFSFAKGDTNITIAKFNTSADKLEMNAILDDGMSSATSFTAFDGDGTASNNAVIEGSSVSALTISNAARFETVGGANDAQKMELDANDQAIFVNVYDNGHGETGTQIFLINNDGTAIQQTLVATLTGINDLAFDDFVTLTS